jgi:hypothetical protein
MSGLEVLVVTLTESEGGTAQFLNHRINRFDQISTREREYFVFAYLGR